MIAYLGLCIIFSRFSLIAQIPQLYENYTTGKAEGVSLAFLAVWLIGDLTNLIGAIWASLVPTVIALAIYFCIADAVLISQCLYYRYISTSSKDIDDSPQDNMAPPNQPLLANASSNIGLPGSRRRSSASWKHSYLGVEASTPIRSPTSGTLIGDAVKNSLSVLAICMLGGAAWVIAWQLGLWEPTVENDSSGTTRRNAGAETLGYVSATLYLGLVLAKTHHLTYLAHYVLVSELEYLRSSRTFETNLVKVTSSRLARCTVSLINRKGFLSSFSSSACWVI